MIVRLLAGGLVAAAAIGAARADDAYTLPAVGTQMTYRLVSTAKLLEKSLSVTAGQVYTYTITAVNGPVAEATVKPVAMIYGCPTNDTRSDCAFAAKVAGAKREGDLITVPVPNDIGDALARTSSVKLHYFLTEERHFPMPGPKNPDDPSDAEFGVEPIFVLTNKLGCDYDQLAAFFPIGKTQHLAVPCHNIFSRTQARLHNSPDQNADEAVSVEFSDDGAGQTTLPSGAWDVRKVSLKFVPPDEKQPSARSDFEIATKLGLPVRTHTSVEIPASHLQSESTTELIAIKP